MSKQKQSGACVAIRNPEWQVCNQGRIDL